MKHFCLLLIGVVVGWAAAGVDWTRDVYAQQAGTQRQTEPVLDDLQRRVDDLTKAHREAAQEKLNAGAIVDGNADIAQSVTLPGRYQISAYGSQASNGAYVVDTATGKVWKVGGGRVDVKTSELTEK
jgi:hypothetical protein